MGHMNNDKKSKTSKEGVDWRVLYRQDTDPMRKKFPRDQLPTGYSRYLRIDGLMARPVTGLHKLSRAAEYLLARTRRRAIQTQGVAPFVDNVDILLLYEKITRYQRSILHIVGRRKTFRENEIKRIRAFIRENLTRLIACGGASLSDYRIVHCPIFKVGELPLMTLSDAQLLVELLLSARAQGMIPANSKLNIASSKLKSATAEVLRRIYLNA